MWTLPNSVSLCQLQEPANGGAQCAPADQTEDCVTATGRGEIAGEKEERERKRESDRATERESEREERGERMLKWGGLNSHRASGHHFFVAECTAFQVMELPSGARYCILASGTAYNASMADPQGLWLVKMPKSAWPAAYVTTTTTVTTTTVTTTTTTVTTTTLTTTETRTTTTFTEVTSTTGTPRPTTNTTTTMKNITSGPPETSTTAGITSTVTSTTSEEERDFHDMGISAL
eukprot:Skav233322  [mRNA]  locus=scaffold3767:313275:317406:- [translate_table: standard]